MAQPFNKVNSFVEAMPEGVHDFENDTIKVALTDTAPGASDSQLSDITEISAGNGYTAGGSQATVSSSSQSSGTYKLIVADVTFAASGGPIGSFRYAVAYNDSATNDELIGWWDYGSSITLQDGESFTFDADAANGIIQLS